MINVLTKRKETYQVQQKKAKRLSFSFSLSSFFFILFCFSFSFFFFFALQQMGFQSERVVNETRQIYKENIKNQTFMAIFRIH